MRALLSFVVRLLPSSFLLLSPSSLLSRTPLHGCARSSTIYLLPTTLDYTRLWLYSLSLYTPLLYTYTRCVSGWRARRAYTYCIESATRRERSAQHTAHTGKSGAKQSSSSPAHGTRQIAVERSRSADKRCSCVLVEEVHTRRGGEYLCVYVSQSSRVRAA